MTSPLHIEPDLAAGPPGITMSTVSDELSLCMHMPILGTKPLWLDTADGYLFGSMCVFLLYARVTCMRMLRCEKMHTQYYRILAYV